MCATCGLVSLRETWEACGGCPNGHAAAAPWNASEAARASGDGAARADGLRRRPDGRRGHGRARIRAASRALDRARTGRDRRCRSGALAHARPRDVRADRHHDGGTTERAAGRRGRGRRDGGRTRRLRLPHARGLLPGPLPLRRRLVRPDAHVHGRVRHVLPGPRGDGPGRPPARGRDRSRATTRRPTCAASRSATCAAPACTASPSRRGGLPRRRLHAPHPPGGARRRAADQRPPGPGRVHDPQPAGGRPLPGHVQLRRHGAARAHDHGPLRRFRADRCGDRAPGNVRGTSAPSVGRDRLPLHARAGRDVPRRREHGRGRADRRVRDLARARRGTAARPGHRHAQCRRRRGARPAGRCAPAARPSATRSPPATRAPTARPAARATA